MLLSSEPFHTSGEEERESESEEIPRKASTFRAADILRFRLQRH